MNQFEKLRNANRERQAIWDPEGLISGPFGALFRSNEMGGETGEAQNEVKKLVREAIGIRGSRTTTDKLAEELADVIITADLTANEFNIDLWAAVAKKFNYTSRSVGIDVFLD